MLTIRRGANITFIAIVWPPPSCWLQVYRSTGVGLDVTEKCKLQGSDLERIRNAKNPASQFLFQLIQLWQKGKTDQYPTLHELLLAVATAIRSSLVETQSGAVTVEIASPSFYGATVFTSEDKLPRDKKADGARGAEMRTSANFWICSWTGFPRRRALNSY